MIDSHMERLSAHIPVKFNYHSKHKSFTRIFLLEALRIFLKLYSRNLTCSFFEKYFIRKSPDKNQPYYSGIIAYFLILHLVEQQMEFKLVSKASSSYNHLSAEKNNRVLIKKIKPQKLVLQILLIEICCQKYWVLIDFD